MRHAVYQLQARGNQALYVITGTSASLSRDTADMWRRANSQRIEPWRQLLQQLRWLIWRLHPSYNTSLKKRTWHLLLLCDNIALLVHAQNWNLCNGKPSPDALPKQHNKSTGLRSGLFGGHVFGSMKLTFSPWRFCTVLLVLCDSKDVATSSSKMSKLALSHIINMHSICWPWYVRKSFIRHILAVSYWGKCVVAPCNLAHPVVTGHSFARKWGKMTSHKSPYAVYNYI